MPEALATPDYSPARVLVRAGRQHPNRMSIIWPDNSVWTVAESADAVRRVATYLRSLGIGEGDRVVFAGRNNAWVFVLHVACSWLHAVTVPLSERLPLTVTQSIVDSLDPALVLIDEVAPALQRSVSVGAEFMTVDAFASSALDSTPIEGEPPACAHETGAIVFTSGSTGRTRGVELTHAHMWWGSMCFRDGFEYLPARDVVGVCAPISHIGGFNGTSMDVFSHGGTIIVFPTFNPADILRAIEKHRISMMFAVPVMCHMLLDTNESVGADISSWERPLIGGDAMGPALAERLRSAGLRPIHVWGMTETSGAGMMTSPDADAPAGALGQPFPYVDARLMNADGHLAGVGELGEIEVRGPGVSTSFVTNGERGFASMHDDWLCTGDLATCDENGWYHIVGRASRMINTGGELVAPGRIEELLRGLPHIANACVVGVKDDRWGQVVAAAIVRGPIAEELRDAADFDALEIADLISDQCAPWERVRRAVWVDALPQLPNGKPDIQATQRLFD